MQIVNKILIGLVLLLTSFSIGRYTAPKSTSETKTIDRTHTVTQIVTVKAPDGTTKTITTIDQHETEKTDKLVSTTPTRPKNNLSVLASSDFSTRGLAPKYGASFTREFIGPITVGAFGLQSGIIGLSIGVNF